MNNHDIDLTDKDAITREAQRLKAEMYASQGLTPDGKYIPDDQREAKQSETPADWSCFFPKRAKPGTNKKRK